MIRKVTFIDDPVSDVIDYSDTGHGHGGMLTIICVIAVFAGVIYYIKTHKPVENEKDSEL